MANKVIPTTPFLKLTTDPEDVSYDVKRVNENSKKIDTFANGLNKTVASNKTDADKKIASLEERKINKSEIGDSLKDVAKKEDITDLETHIDSNLVGENLITNTSNEFGTVYTCKGADGMLIDGDRLDFKNLEQGDILKISVQFKFTDLQFGKKPYVSFHINGGQTGTGDGKIFAHPIYLEEKHKNGIYTLVWTRSILKVYSKNDYFERPQIFYTNIESGTIQMRNLKIEKSNATVWTPSPLDVINKVDKLNEDLIDQATENTKRFDTIDTEIADLKRLMVNELLEIKAMVGTENLRLSNTNKKVDDSNSKLDTILKLIEAENKKFSALNDSFDSLLK